MGGWQWLGIPSGDSRLIHPFSGGREPQDDGPAWLMRLIIVLQCSLMMMSSAFVRRYPLASPRNRHTSSVALQGQKIAIVGGGLAGMGTLFHLLDQSDDAEVTVFDRAPVGTAGASSVAG